MTKIIILKTTTLRKMAERPGSRSHDGCIKKDGDKKIIISSIHDTGVKLTKLDKRVKTLNALSWPYRMTAIGEENRPKGGRFPHREKNDPFDLRGGADLLPCWDKFPNRRRDENTFARPIH